MCSSTKLQKNHLIQEKTSFYAESILISNEIF